MDLDPAPTPASERIGIRDLRTRVADVVRRAEGGERIVITVDGAPVARLGPLDVESGPADLDVLIAAGMLRAPDRPDRPAAPEPIDLPVDARLDGILTSLRGGR